MWRNHDAVAPRARVRRYLGLNGTAEKVSFHRLNSGWYANSLICGARQADARRTHKRVSASLVNVIPYVHGARAGGAITHQQLDAFLVL